MTTPPPDERPLFPVASPFRRRWAEARRLSSNVPRVCQDRRLLFGLVRRIMYPGIALQVSGQMGPVRHALAQRVVAGTMYIQSPFPALDQSKAAAAQQKAQQLKDQQVQQQREKQMQQLKDQQALKLLRAQQAQQKNPLSQPPPASDLGRKPST